MPAGPLVIDASVVVEYLVDLGQTDAADLIFHDALASDSRLWAPDLVYAESTNAIRKLVARGAIQAKEGDNAVRRLGHLPLHVSGTRPLLGEMWELRRTVTPYDACYVTLARRLRIPLVTADEKLARTLKRDDVLLLNEVR